MWIYKKHLQYPVRLTNTNPRLAKVIITQFGSADSELAASMRYLSQRYTMPFAEGKALLTDIGTEELAHLEIVGAIVRQLTCRMSVAQIKAAGFEDYFVNHTAGVFPLSSNGTPFMTSMFAVKGDPVTDLHENMAAEQKARTTYENILRLSDDPDVNDIIKFLRQREIVHYQRFGELLRLVQDRLDSKNFYAYNLAFDGKK